MLSSVSKAIVGLLLVGYVLLAVTGVFAAWGMTPPQQVAFAILLIAATLWISEAIPLFVTSFVILALSATWLLQVFEAAGESVPREAFLAPFFSDIILLFLGGFVLSSALHKFQVDEQAASWVMKKAGSSPARLLAGIIGITALNSMFLSNTATAAMMLALCLPILNRLPAEHRFRQALLLSVPFAANIGGMGTPIGTPPNAIAMTYLAGLGRPIGFVTWMLMAIPIVVTLLVFVWLLLQITYRSEGPVEIEQIAESRRVSRSPTRFVAMVVAALTVVGWLTGGWHGLSAGTVALLPIVFFFGSRILDIKDYRGLSWDVLFVMGGGLCLGVVIASTGLDGWMLGLLPLGDQIGVLTYMIVLAVVACLLSSLMSNTATANLIMPIVMGMAVTDRSPLLVAVAFACSVAMALPISTPPNAIAFSSGELTVRDLMRPGVVVSIVGLVLIFAVGRPWWSLLATWLES